MMNDFQNYLDNNLKNIQINEFVKSEYFIHEYDVYKEIRNLISDIRIKSGFTQKQLAEKSGLTQANISNIENGSTRPTIESLKKIADATGKRLVIDFKDNEVN